VEGDVDGEEVGFKHTVTEDKYFCPVRTEINN
jgi:hypothetical protein